MAKKTARPRTTPVAKAASDAQFMALADQMNVRQLFMKRMEREGRSEEYKRRCDEAVRAGTARETAHKDVASEMGRYSVGQERKLYLAYLAEQYTMKEKSDSADLQRVQRTMKEEEDYIAALKNLPDTADPEAELRWIRSHPAMTTMDRRRGKRNGDAAVLITARDVNKTHGTAPSKAAVNALQNWVNRPDKFYEMMMSEQKKVPTTKGRPRTMAGMGTSAGQTSDDDDLTEIDSLLGGK